MPIVVIADDFSGAAELGVAARRFGLSAEVQTDLDTSAPVDVCLVDTDSRWLPPDLAVARVAQVARRLIAAPVDLIYKKVDSLLRGPVLAEIRAAARTLGRPRVLLLPANPRRGRLIRDGRYFVDGRPLDETPFAADPEHPRRSASVRELLDAPDVAVRSAKVSAGLDETHVAAPDVVDADDLRRRAAELTADVLPAGAAEFFEAILERRLGRPPAPPDSIESCTPADFAADFSAADFSAAGFASVVPSSGVDGLTNRRGARRLAVCGSAAGWRRRADEARAAGTPVVEAPGELFESARSDEAVERFSRALADRLHDSPAVLVGLGERAYEPGAVPANALTRRLAAAVHGALAARPVDALLLEGGATAAAVIRQFGWHRLQVVGDVGSGVARLAPVGPLDGPAPRLFVKPGSYAWPAPFWAAFVASPDPRT